MENFTISKHSRISLLTSVGEQHFLCVVRKSEPGRQLKYQFFFGQFFKQNNEYLLILDGLDPGHELVLLHRVWHLEWSVSVEFLDEGVVRFEALRGEQATEHAVQQNLNVE